MKSVDFMLQFDDETYDDIIDYVGPFWAPKFVTTVLSQDFAVNYLAFLHDKAYDKPMGFSVKEIDFHFTGAIIEETGNIDLAKVYGQWVKSLNFISWWSSRIKESYVKFRNK